MTAIGVVVVVTAVTNVTVAGPTFMYAINAGFMQPTYSRTALEKRGADFCIFIITHDRTYPHSQVARGKLSKVGNTPGLSLSCTAPRVRRWLIR